MLRPALTGLVVKLDGGGVPRTAALKLDQKLMHDDGQVTFAFVEAASACGADRFRGA